MVDTPHQHDTAPSPWVLRFLPLLPHDGTVLDLACGSGRHVLALLAAGHAVIAVDRDVTGVRALAAPRLEVVEADLEAGAWPLDGRRFAGIIVTNYLHRPLLPALVAAVQPGGVLIYETFARGNERFGKPSNPDFLLQPGELLETVRGRLRVIAYEDLEVQEPKPAMIQRIAAIA
jgi:SAM-dependent methyltransferase